MVSLRHGQPIPVRPVGSVAIDPTASLLEDDEGGSRHHWRNGLLVWEAGEVAGRRLAAVGWWPRGRPQVEMASAFDATSLAGHLLLSCY